MSEFGAPEEYFNETYRNHLEVLLGHGIRGTYTLQLFDYLADEYTEYYREYKGGSLFQREHSSTVKHLLEILD